MEPLSRVGELLLHHLSHDSLSAILLRLDADDLQRLSLVPSHAIASVARADITWAPILRSVFGNSITTEVLQTTGSSQRFQDISPLSGQTNANAECQSGRPLLPQLFAGIPTWLADHFRNCMSLDEEEDPSRSTSVLIQNLLGGLSLEHENLLDHPEAAQLRPSEQPTTRFVTASFIAFKQCCDFWQRQPTPLTAFRILMRLVPPSFASDPARCITKLTRDEASEQDKARVLATFFHLNAREWAWCRKSPHDTCLRTRVADAVVRYITTPKTEPGAELARAACRTYLCSFDLKGLHLVSALRLLMSHTRMPTEGKRMRSLLWGFAGAYYERNHHTHACHDSVYLMIMSLVMLNADAHNTCVKTKMSEAHWIANTKKCLDALHTNTPAMTPAPPDLAPDPPSRASDTDLREMYVDVTSHALLMVPDYSPASEKQQRPQETLWSRMSSSFAAFFSGFVQESAQATILALD
jgi:hypothetical protein